MTDNEGNFIPGSNEPHPSLGVLVCQGVVFPLDQEVISVGRSLGNQLIIDHPRVSRLHAQLIAIGDQHMLIDENSTNGTFVNGRRVTRAMLKSEDTVAFADVSMVYFNIAQGMIEQPPGRTGPLVLRFPEEGPSSSDRKTAPRLAARLKKAAREPQSH